MYYSQDPDAVGEFYETRFEPDYKKFLPHLVHGDRNKTKKKIIITKFGNFCTFLSADNPKNRRSRSSRLVVVDESAALKTGALSECEKRTHAYQLTNALVLEVSTPEEATIMGSDGTEKPTDFFESWSNSTQNIWHVKCTSCGEFVVQHHDNYTWIEDETTKPGGGVEGGEYRGGTWDIMALKRSLRWECPECETELPLDGSDYAQLLREGKYVCTAPQADPAKRGYHYHGLSVLWAPAADLMVRYIVAKEAAAKGLLEPLKKVLTNDFGEFSTGKAMSVAGKLGASVGGYHCGEKEWEEEHVFSNGIKARVLGVDVQGDYMVASVVGYAQNGDMRIYDTRRLFTWEEVAATRDEFGIYEGVKHKSPKKWKAGLVAVDNAWGRTFSGRGSTSATEVNKMCSKYNFHAVAGRDVANFPVVLPNKQRVLRLYSKTQILSAGNGLYTKSFQFSADSINSHLSLILSGQTEITCELPDDYSNWCTEELTGKQLQEGKWETVSPDHTFDSIKMTLPFAYSWGFFTNLYTPDAKAAAPTPRAVHTASREMN